MKKIIALLCIALLIVGCTGTPSTPKEDRVAIKVLTPRGAPALSLIPIVKDESAQVTFVDGSDVLQAAFVNPTPEYDVIIAPTNLGTKLGVMNKTTYKMLGVITWGNLYLVAENEDALNQDGTLAAFGEGAVPGFVFESVFANVAPEVVYYNSVTDAQAALLSDKANVALLAEPAATATLGKLKEQGKEFKIIKDLQKEFESVSGATGYPQAAIYVLEESYKNNPAAFDLFVTTIDTYINNVSDETMDDFKVDIDMIGAEELGVPNAKIASKTWSRLNVRYAPAKDVREQLDVFLKLFGIENIDGTLIQ